MRFRKVGKREGLGQDGSGGLWIERAGNGGYWLGELSDICGCEDHDFSLDRT
jgi:hypothetical protein